MSSLRLAVAALCLSSALPVLATEPAPATTPVEPAPVVRQPLPERSQEDAAALERQLPPAEQQQLQALDDTFLALWKPANSNDPSGVVVIVPGAGETADWPRVVGPLRNKLPDVNWASLSLTLPDMRSQASLPRTAELENSPTEPATNSSSKEASTTAKPIEQAASAGTDNADVEPQPEQTLEALTTADAERIFARIDAALDFAQQQHMRSVVLLGHGTGAYWAARYMSEKQPKQVQKLVLVAAQSPAQVEPNVNQLTPTLSVALLDVFYKDQPLMRTAALQRLQASKRMNRTNFTQVGLNGMAGNRDAEHEQLLRRVRGWLSPQAADKPD
ncbi:alpha/beta hydrolase family protein [Pseudomonas sp. 7P_10.2_Bac1]|uniref:alpha/beta hydrolase family protein n=1 Tax=Pseudomonas sp. 7P_10.2_Bac1 TaxID=2971614 RepID=UPI0021C81ED4|nr:alpha/beta hydrolase family protein [Pseudomonas sp. 7P_10.2_Bac1]MCU1726566.1 alpha/beta hydrolase family protein [Pseudomonas sp. 7P_10.2_Bac1]